MLFRPATPLDAAAIAEVHVASWRTTYQGLLPTELYAIYLLAKHQGTGVGRELARLVASFLSDQGHTSMRVWVLAGNPAEGFYQRIGGQRLEEKAIEIGGTEYREVAYGWRTLVGLSN